MKNSEVFFDMLVAAGFKPGIDFYKHADGIYLNGDSVNYLLKALQPEMTEELENGLKPQDFTIEDLPKWA
jgi:hypothetical protein